MEKKNKEILVNKWLEGTLSSEELAQFKALDEYKEYVKISENAKHFKAPIFDIDSTFESIQIEKNKSPKTNSSVWWKVAAAVVVLFMGSYLIISQSNNMTSYTTGIAEQKTIILPDNSEVILNASSEISFDKDNWDSQRQVALDGEAFFKVAKGQKFDVLTDEGVVSVLGTQFNVKQRPSYLAVQTYEGLVSVKAHSEHTVLAAGNGIQIIDGTSHILNNHSELFVPTWTKKISTFESVPYTEVIAEMERQYTISIQTSNTETTALFTGSFTHTNLDQALKTITLPMNLTYHVNGATVILTKE